MNTTQPLLDITDLTVEFATRVGTVRAVENINISIAPRRNHRHRGRVRLRQVGHVLCADAHSGSRRPHRIGLNRLFRD